MRKPLVVMLILIGSMALLTAVGLGVYFYVSQSAKPQSSAQLTASAMKDLRVDLPTNTTNLKDGLIQFTVSVVADNQKTKQELTDMQPMVQDAINRTMREFTRDQVTATDGYQRLAQAIQDSLNHLLPSGKVVHVYFASIVVQ